MIKSTLNLQLNIILKVSKQYMYIQKTTAERELFVKK